jgi:hypothetical protein
MWRRRVAVVAGVAVLSAAVAVAVVGAASSSPSSANVAGPATPTATRVADADADSRWRPVLERLDAARSTAWRHGDPAALRRVYRVGSAALRADQRSLSAYLARGLRPAGVRLNLKAINVTRRDRGTVVLDVVDRLGPMSVVGVRDRPTRLPRDRPTSHTITLRRGPNGWRIAAVGAD